MSNVITSKDQDVIDHIRKAFNDSSEFQMILTLFEKYPELEKIRTTELAKDMEDCYGIWGGGDYYSRALDIVLNQWSSRELTKEQSYAVELETEIQELRTENSKLIRRADNLMSIMMRIIQMVCTQAGKVGPDFQAIVDDWHRSCVDHLNNSEP